MKSIKNVFPVINRELYYQWNSKKIVIVSAILFLLVIIHLFGLYNNVISKYDRYLATEQYYKEQGLDIAEELKAPLETKIDGNIVSNSNAIKADFTELSISIQNLKSVNIISNTLEYIVFVFCTLIYGIYACFVATYDYKNKTYKNIAVKHGQNEIILGKLISCVIVMIGTLIMTLLLSFTGGFVVVQAVKRKVPIDSYTISSFKYESDIILQILFSFAVLMFYIVIGFTISYVAKNMIAPTILILIYGLLLPVLGSYDFRNIISYFSHKLFTFTGRFVIFSAEPINEIFGILLMLATSGILIFTCVTVSHKRSAY